MDKFKLILTSIYYCLVCKWLLFIGRYDRKYCTGRFFSRKYFGIFSSGWKIMYDDWRLCKKNRKNTNVPWPVNPSNHVAFPENIFFHPDDLNNFNGYGVYFQAYGKIVIGHGTYIGPNVGLITSNHDVSNLDDHLKPKSIIIGDGCWIGMNSIILPGVVLGENTIVGAGAVVTKSFTDGNCTIVGNPAKVIKKNIKRK